MTDMAKTTLWLIIILVLLGGIWWFVGGTPEVKTPVAPVQAEQVNNLQATTTEPVQPEDASTTISVQDKTDEALSADLNKVDAQLQILNVNSTN